MFLQSIVISLLLGHFAPASAQTSTVTTFREGGDTYARGINNQGQIAGFLVPSNNPAPRGFLRAADGTIQTVLAPGALETRLHGINDQGDTVGTRDANTRAFLRTSAGVFTEINVADAIAVTAYGINNNGFVTGGFQKLNAPRRAYLRNLAGSIVPLADIYPNDIEAVAISNRGDRVALMQTTNSGASTTIYLGDALGNFPGFFPNLPGLSGPYYARGLNASNVLVGEINGQGFLVRSPGDGVTFSIPNTTATMPYGINDQGQVVGAVRDSENRISGFVMNPCSPTLSATTRSHGSGTEAGSLELTANGFCVWTAETDVPWITLTKSIGNGSGTIRYTLVANTLFERTGRIRVGTQEFVITQARGDCRYTVTPTGSTSVPAQGGTITFGITTSSSCPWTVSAPDAWVHLSPPSGTGNATITVQVDSIPAEATSLRSSNVNIAGVSVVISQLPVPCDFQLSRTLINAPAEGSLENVRVSARTACTWYLSIDSSWISTIAPSYNQGTATISFRIARNPGITARSSTVSIYNSSAGPLPTISISQAAGAACSYSLTSDNYTAPGEGTSASFQLVTGASCPYTAVSKVPWIEITATPSVPPGYVPYRVLPNPSRLPRRGTIEVAGLVFTIDQLGSTQTGLGFVPLTACRVMDTRPNQGFTSDQGPPALQGNAVRALYITGRCGVPTNARAYVLNITAYPIGGLGYVTVWPANGPRPTASTLNSFNGRVVSNLTVVPASSFAPVALYASDTTNVAVDVTGYFADPALDSLVLYPVQPCRVVDTRTTNTPLAAGSSRDVSVTGRCGVPANAAAVSLNATAVPRGALDSLTVWTSGKTRPVASTLNAPGGQVTANATLLATGTNGAVSVFATNETDFLLDVNGYFGSPSATGLYFNPVTPCRIADTRTGYGGSILAAGVVRAIVPRTTACGIPTNAMAHMVNATAVPPGPLAFLSLFPAPAWTGSSTLNAFDGQVTANLAIVPDTGQGIGVFASDPAHVVLDISGYFATLPADERRPAVIPNP